jgi:hypothetical protein
VGCALGERSADGFLDFFRIQAASFDEKHEIDQILGPHIDALKAAGVEKAGGMLNVLSWDAEQPWLRRRSSSGLLQFGQPNLPSVNRILDCLLELLLG